ncbi:MAG: polynucleotide 5'-hydroxyl-kinase [Desulfobacca sp.]|nr:polynucleotide 5'-hydroxyl-kinase [Desulfobacca sp.]
MSSDQSLESFPLLTGLDLPRAWEQAAGRFLETEGLTLVLGGTDSGKSTLCRYLVYRAYVAGQRVALIDCDLGQSHLGPPATLGLGLYPPRQPGDDGLFPEALYFIGQTSPVGQVLEVVVGTRRLADQARDHGIRWIVVNTSGFIQGPGALQLKWAQMELLAPQLILALEKAQELESILIPLRRRQAPMMRLPRSQRAVAKSWEDRRQYREARFRGYFRDATRHLFSMSRLAWQGLPLGRGQPLALAQRPQLGAYLDTPVLFGEISASGAVLILQDLPETLDKSALAQLLAVPKVCWLAAASLEMRLVGLLDGKLAVLALGLLLPSPWDRSQVAIWTPLPSEGMDQVRVCRVGKLRLNLRGQELNRI